ncbi:LuxR C-terminal-related transcriptional regulator [Oscillospiraceae bacterium OttesenSCG-928-F05]|nr:LuxR C-terminal-related transcriptional regulator [Oscillospiraceae bacterium OttesenSCG-928-F05]
MNQMKAPVAPRTELMKSWDALKHQHILFISAPAGCGKSIACRLWIDRHKSVFSIVNLDTYDNSLQEFCRRVSQGLLNCQPDNAPLRDIVRHASFDRAPDEFLVRAAGALDAGIPCCLMLDDLHYIHNPEVTTVLSAVLNRIPLNFKILMTSRNDPPPLLSGFIMKRTMALITADQLTFNPREIQDFFSSHGRPLSKKQAELVFESTGGWAICINALLLSEADPSDDQSIQTHLWSFVRAEIWQKWDERTRRFLLATSLFDELTTELCFALTGDADSGKLLDSLAKQNAFLLVTTKGTYRFHHLFREFLISVLDAMDGSFRWDVLMKAGAWYLSRSEHYKALDCYLKCGDEAGIIKSFREITDFSSPHFVISNVQAAVHKLHGHAFFENHPRFQHLIAWVHFIEGNAAEAERYLDSFFSNLTPEDFTNPAVQSNVLSLSCLDYRTSLPDFVRRIESMAIKAEYFPVANTFSQYMPFFHRSSRDFSDYAFSDPGEVDRQISHLQKVIGGLFGRERYMLESCLRAGLSYEQGRLTDAHQFALLANAQIQDTFMPESRFCAMVILIHILDALWRPQEALEVLEQIYAMVERTKAYYLNPNLSAVAAARRIESGDIAAADSWVKDHSSSTETRLDFYKAYSHYTTARALIALGRYDKAVILLERLLVQGKRYRRPLDVIEAKILLAIAYWKRKRNYQKTALSHLENAITLAQRFGYVQLFANEGGELTNMLHRLQHKAMRQDYTGEASGSFTRLVYLQTYARSKHQKGLTSGQAARPVKFTDQQKRVMTFMCDGYSYRKIADAMGLKFSTIRSHIELIYKKLDVPNEMEAITKIRELGILDE